MSTNQPVRIAIIGGGISGLATALYLEQQFLIRNSADVEITLFESDERLGGKIQTVTTDQGAILELGAESFLSRKLPGIELCRELDLENRLTGTRPENRKTFVWRDDKLHPLPPGLSGFVPGNLRSLYSTSLLSFAGKTRVALDWVIPGRKSDDDESIANFVCRRLGKQAYERLVQPLLCGIYCGDGHQLSLQATFPELQKLEKKHGSLLRGLRARNRSNSSSPQNKDRPPFVTLPKGMSELIQKLSKKLAMTEIRLNTRVDSVEKSETGNGFDLKVSSKDPDGKTENAFDRVVVAVPAHIAATMFESLEPLWRKTLSSIPHVSTATVNLWYDRASLNHDLRGYGFVIPASEQQKMTAVTWTSSKHFERTPENLCSVRAYVGREGDEIDESTTDEQLLSSVLLDLRRTMGLTTRPLGSLIHRWPQGSPQYTLGHLERLETIDLLVETHRGLYLCGCSYRGVGIPDCIRDAKRTAEILVQSLKQEA